ncbi:MAG: ABC transporter ATP-binding protein [Flaviflexus sp.]|nr:ABC transporter ATP-binding protein [Flaviflexus sp.]
MSSSANTPQPGAQPNAQRGTQPASSSAPPLVRVENLRVSFPNGSGGELVAVNGISFSLRPGTCLALVGESGSGKSVTARSLMGLTGGRVSADRLEVAGEDALMLSQRGWRELRRRHLAMVPQDALMALDPLRPVGREIADAARGRPRRERHAAVLDILESVGMTNPGRAARSRSPELSGGMRQRALIAQALVGDPALVIADEATTALDTRLTALVLEHLAEMKRAGRAVLLISHDLAQVAYVADFIAVMRSGRIVEAGPTSEVLSSPGDDYTAMLLSAIPDHVPRFTPLKVSSRAQPPHPRPAEATQSGIELSGIQQSGIQLSEPSGEIALRATGLSKTFGDLTAVDGVSLAVPAGATLGIVGESGCGKTTTARLILGLTAPDEGEVELRGERFIPRRESERRRLRHQLGAVYQNPLGSFDARYRVGEILADALTGGRSRSLRGHSERIEELLLSVHLSPDILRRYPAELSGGQRQRLAIARALAPRPAVLVLDEPVSALDVSIQARVLDLLDEIQLATATSYLFISHDLGVVEHMSDEVAVMHGGTIVERGTPAHIFSRPEHPYSRALVEARMQQTVPPTMRRKG